MTITRKVTWILVILLTVSAQATQIKPRTLPTKPAKAVIAPGFDRRHIEVKFLDGADIGLLSGGYPFDRSVGFPKSNAQQIIVSLTAAGGIWQRVSPCAEEEIDHLVATAETRLNRDLADLNNYFVLTVPDGVRAEDWIDRLNSLPEVEIARAMPLAAPLPLPGDYQSQQGYLNDAPAGIGASSAWAQNGGNGDGCFGSKICDFEYSWNLNHHDIAASYNEMIPSGYTASDPFNDDSHGTAVLGEMISFNNGWGTIGASHGAAAWAAPTFLNGSWQIGTALLHVLSLVQWQPGAVFLIEQQMAGPNYPGGPTQDGMIPVEWWQSWYDIIVTCVGNGVTVVECAGNGKENLDAPIYSTGNGGHWPFLPQNNSGAIIVGAGAAPAAFGGSDVDRSRLVFSNYGSRLDLQGWGERVMTTGYGTYYSADGKDYWYTNTFAGTSSAAPMVAAAAAILQSIYKKQGNCQPLGYGTALDPDSVRSILRRTGSPQQSGTYPATQNIGPRPNLVAAIAALPPACVCTDSLYCDLNRDMAINPVDVVRIVNFVYKSIDARLQIATCPGDNGDWDCDGNVNPVDVVRYVNFVYKSSTVIPCNPCACSPYPTNCP